MASGQRTGNSGLPRERLTALRAADQGGYVLRVSLSTFRQVVIPAVRDAGGRVGAIIEPGVTPNFIAAQIDVGARQCWILRSHAGDWAFVEAIEPALSPLRFTEFPPVADAMARLSGVVPLTRAELVMAFSGRPGVSDADVRYWKPQTVGDALFNWWD